VDIYLPCKTILIYNVCEKHVYNGKLTITLLLL
jgi:hypothetical protein